MSARSESTADLRQNVIKQQCVVLHLPTVASQCAPLAEQAERERQPYLGYLEALFAAELEDRERRAIAGHFGPTQPRARNAYFNLWI